MALTFLFFIDCWNLLQMQQPGCLCEMYVVFCGKIDKFHFEHWQCECIWHVAGKIPRILWLSRWHTQTQGGMYRNQIWVPVIFVFVDRGLWRNRGSQFAINILFGTSSCPFFPPQCFQPAWSNFVTFLTCLCGANKRRAKFQDDITFIRWLVSFFESLTHWIDAQVTRNVTLSSLPRKLASSRPTPGTGLSLSTYFFFCGRKHPSVCSEPQNSLLPSKWACISK